MPERSHMLKTWPTKAGPPPFLLELIPAIRTVDGDPELEGSDDEAPELDETESDPTGERVEEGGEEESANLSGMQSLEAGADDSWGWEDGVVLVGLMRERRVEVVVLMKLDMWFWRWLGSAGEAMEFARWLPVLRNFYVFLEENFEKEEEGDCVQSL